MARKFFRRFMPDREQLVKDRFIRLFGSILHSPRLWQLNRNSVSRGVAWGLFWAFIPTPLQTVFATACAIPTRANVPLAIALTWVSNPLTMIPCAYAAYRLGLVATGQPPIPDDEFRQLFSHFAALDFAEAWSFITSNLNRLWPFFVGSVLLGTLAGLTGYLGLHGFWRWNLVRQWRKRGHRVNCRVCKQPVPPDANRCVRCGAPATRRARIGAGLASIARLAAQRQSARGQY